jgi:hypothetical protein
METCQRCNEEGEDRRTLWMACFYEMGELGLPFEQTAVKGVPLKFSHIENYQPFNIPVPKFEEIPDAKERLYKFFTLRVCKGCRADWMHAIKTWFNSENEREPEDEFTDGVAYVRDLGAIRKMTPDEIAAFKTRAT